MVLSGINTYDGGTSLDAGTIRAVTDAAALGTGTVTLAAGTTLELASDTATSFGNNVVVAGSATIVSDRATSGAGVTHTLGTLSIGAFTLTVSKGANVASGTAGLTLGATTLTGGATVSSGTDVLTTLGNVTGAGQALTVDGAGNTTLSGGLNTGTSGALTKNGAGTLNITAGGDYTGITTINAGTLAVTVNDALGTVAGNTGRERHAGLPERGLLDGGAGDGERRHAGDLDRDQQLRRCGDTGCDQHRERRRNAVDLVGCHR